jgi:hypothetical protein
VATFDNWLKLENEWMGILRKFEIPLDGKEGHDHALMERLTMTASEYTTIGVSVAVNNEHFQQILPLDVRGFWRDPYFFCAWGLLQSLSTMEERWTFDLGKHKPLWFLFDPRQKARQFAAEIFYNVKSQSKQPNTFGEMGFGEMWRTPQIQATDLLVYEATRHKLEYDHDQSVGLRRSLDTLGRKKRLFAVEVDEEQLRVYVEAAQRKQLEDQDA